MPLMFRRDYSGPRIHARGELTLAAQACRRLSRLQKFPRTLMRRSILAPDSERFLRRAIGDREQHRFLPHPMGVMLPRRHHEHVVRAPFQYLAVDRGRALPFGADKDGAVGGAVFLALEAIGEERQFR